MNSANLSVALVVADAALRAETLACLESLPVRIAGDQKQIGQGEELLDRLEAQRVDVILLEAGLLAIPLADFARRLKMTTSQPAIFILHKEAVASKILEAIQAGAREYLCPPLAAPLSEAFGRLAEIRSEQVLLQQRKLGRIFGFISAKGGCGATTFASHVATAVSRQTDKPALLADLDFDAGLLRFVLKARATYSIHDALDNMHRMDASYWNALVTRQANKLDFIAAPEEMTARTLPDPRQLARLLRFLRNTYPIVILDFGRCFSAAALDSLSEMETLYLITTQDLSAYEHARDFLRLAGDRAKGRVNILVNRVSGKQKTDPAAFQSYLGTGISGTFTEDCEGLNEAWADGRLLGDNCDLGRQFAELAKSIVAPEAPEPEVRSGPATATEPAGLGKFFSFMRKTRA